ncbi:MAG: hypothetical protein Q9170_001721 [Blastenia crenularia]
MATQAMLIADTIAGMKRAIARSRDFYSSDSEESIDRFTNRGNKLKRKARYVHEGQLDRPNGPKVYKRRIEHAGYHREIISHNPQRYDEDGDQLGDDEEDEAADMAAADANPYHGIILQGIHPKTILIPASIDIKRFPELLGPLTSAADLPTHPSLSATYLSSTLSNMTQEACEMVQRERNTIRGAKQLLTKLRGDETWIPCSSLDSNVDDMIFDTSKILDEIIRARPSLRSIERRERLGNKTSLVSPDDSAVKTTIGDEPMGERRKDEAGILLSEQENGKISNTGPSESLPISEDLIEARKPGESTNGIIKETGDDGTDTTVRQDFEVQATDLPPSNQPGDSAVMATQITDVDGSDLPSTEQQALESSSPGDGISNTQHLVAGQPDTDDVPGVHEQKSSESLVVPSTEGQEDIIMLGTEEPQATDGDVQPITHRMTTRAQAQAVSDNTTSLRTRSASVTSSYVPSIHPLFLMPQGSRPDRDFGLPAEEAEATRRMLMSYVQKQEEVCRGAEKLYDGLLKAERMKKDVFDSCKAEGHVGEMSDGEDWYDKKEWGLEEDLRKGHDEEEDDAGTQHKKTRARRG